MKIKIYLTLLLGLFTGPALACEEQLLDDRLLQPAMQAYLEKLKSTSWEGIQPFGRLENDAIYLTPEFESLTASQKRHILSLLLLEYGDYKALLTLMSAEVRRQLLLNQGAMLPYIVYSADGRVISIPYNACNRLTVLTEYERSRLGFLGIQVTRSQRYPMSRWQQEQVKKLFWNALGYDRAGDYWIAWVPERGYFEVNVPATGHQELLSRFWAVAPNYYRYVVVEQGTQLYTYFRGELSRG